MRVGWDGENGSVDALGDQGRQRLRRAAGLNIIDLARVDAVVTQRLHREVMRVAADTRDADAFAFQLLRALISGLAMML